MRSHRLVAVRQGDVPEDVLHAVSSLWLGFVEVLTDSEQEVGLADALIADDDDLVEIIERLIRIVDGVRELCSCLAHRGCIRVGPDPQARSLRHALLALALHALRIGGLVKRPRLVGAEDHAYLVPSLGRLDEGAFVLLLLILTVGGVLEVVLSSIVHLSVQFIVYSHGR